MPIPSWLSTIHSTAMQYNEGMHAYTNNYMHYRTKLRWHKYMGNACKIAYFQGVLSHRNACWDLITNLEWNLLAWKWVWVQASHESIKYFLKILSSIDSSAHKKRWIAKTYVVLSHFPPWQELCTHGNSWGKIGSQMHCLLVNCLQEDISSFSRQCQVFHIAMLQRLHAFVSMWPSQFNC